MLRSINLSSNVKCSFGEDAYTWYKRGSHEGWKPDADMYERLLSWMCTQENLVDEAETIVRKEMPVGSSSVPILLHLRVPKLSSWISAPRLTSMSQGGA